MHLPNATRRRIVYATAAVLVCSSTVLTWKQFASKPVTVPERLTASHAAGLHPELTLAKDAPAQPAPAAGGQATLPDTQEQKPRALVEVYTVVEGDVIEAIAERYGLNPDSILSTNNLSEDDYLQIGQELLIPARDGLIVEVEEGDTMWDLANAYGVTDVDIAMANPDVDPDNLVLGQKLLIPGGVRRPQLASRGVSRSSGRKLAWPTWAEITDDFGNRIHPVFGTPHFHDGIDIGVGSGTPVAAAAGGEVIMVSWYGGYGKSIRIDHGNGIVTMYSHLSSYEVSVGDYVSPGDLIGYSGNTGNSTGAHLHFTVIVDGTPVDPMGWLP